VPEAPRSAKATVKATPATASGEATMAAKATDSAERERRAAAQ